MHEVGDMICGEYAVSEVYGNGGMGIVYKVHRSRWDIDMAMKCPRKELFQNDGHRKAFAKECETWMALGVHPNIISCYYYRTIEGAPAVFMEYADRGTLQDCISSGRLYVGTPNEALRRILDIAIQTARGLLHAHQKGYVHQDVKPSNVLLTSSGVAKISDFGLSKSKGLLHKPAGDGIGGSIVVSSGGWTPAYGSPEQALGRPLTRRTDIWSWAVMVLEMIHGKMIGKFGPSAAREFRKLWPWQIFSPGVQPSRGLVKILKECLDEREECRPKDFDAIIPRLTELYEKYAGEEYPRTLPPRILMAEATLCNRIASYAELENVGKDHLAEMLEALHQMRTSFPWSVWGVLNYAVYRHANGCPIDEILRMIENAIRVANTKYAKEWIVNLLLSLGVSSLRDPRYQLLDIRDNPQLTGRILKRHEFLRERLHELFRDETIRHYVADENVDFDRRGHEGGVSENGVARVTVDRKSGGVRDSLTVTVKVGTAEYSVSDAYFPSDVRIVHVTTDDKAKAASLWLFVPQKNEVYREAISLENGKLTLHNCDFRKKGKWGTRVFGIPRRVYVTGDARTTMFIYGNGICSVWLNECGDGRTGRNICVTRLDDFGLIPPETILPELRFERGFEYGVTDKTAYRLMRLLSETYGSVRMPYYISRPESSAAELHRSVECSKWLSRADNAYKSGDYCGLAEPVSKCLQYGILPDENLLSARHKAIHRSESAVPARCWLSESFNEYWDRPVEAIHCCRPGVCHLVSFGLEARAIATNEHGIGVEHSPWNIDFRLVNGESFIVLDVCENGDVIAATCEGWYGKSICRLSRGAGGRQSVVWECQIPQNTMRVRLTEGWQTCNSIVFQTENNQLVRVSKKDGNARIFQTSGFVRFWAECTSAKSEVAEIYATEKEVTATGKHGGRLELHHAAVKACLNGRVCGISSDGRLVLIANYWRVAIYDMISGDCRIIYTDYPLVDGEHRWGGTKITHCSMSSDGRAVAVITLDRKLKVYDGRCGKEVFEWRLEDGFYSMMRFDPSGRWLFVLHDETKIDAFQLFWEHKNSASVGFGEK